ncbi:putative transcriptional acitvator, Baf family [Treponema brennaborense DSM 12168]|uniref:Type III pantothenate kinase n=1 Tax=Treponema brennaborense (strain DSM 12168 / CIP 105900 / DD5/3) TaxID=906968 RepID=F4LML9_TREBD|nr:putative transcriptional acitvator, Baf family [Treponema brennaborense DSM 12168]
MLLAIDIGNTNIVATLFHDDELIHTWRIFSDTRRTGDEYRAILTSFFRDAGVSVASITSCVLSSVVPVLIGQFVGLIEHLTGRKPILVNPTIFPLLPVKIPESAVHEIGSDLVCNAVEAYCRYRSPCIVVDFGTALTFTAIGADGTLLGIAITPGIGTARNALFNNTAQLPSVPLEAPPSSLGTNTIHSIQAGIVLGYKGLVESLINRMKTDMSAQTGIAADTIRIIATGGLNSVLKPITDVFQNVDKSLTLYGLKRIADIVGARTPPESPLI